MRREESKDVPEMKPDWQVKMKIGARTNHIGIPNLDFVRVRYRWPLKLHESNERPSYGELGGLRFIHLAQPSRIPVLARKRLERFERKLWNTGIILASAGFSTWWSAVAVWEVRVWDAHCQPSLRYTCGGTRAAFPEAEIRRIRGCCPASSEPSLPYREEATG